MLPKQERGIALVKGIERRALPFRMHLIVVAAAFVFSACSSGGSSVRADPDEIPMA